MFGHQKKILTPSAAIVDSKLILSLPNALSPVVWQMDLTQTKASALEIVAGKTKGEHLLRLRTPKGDQVDIAPFDTLEKAMEALSQVAKAMESAHGRIAPAANSSARYGGGPIYYTGRSSAVMKLFAFLGMFLLFALLVWFWINISAVQSGRVAQQAALTQQVQQTAQSQQQQQVAPELQAGVPVSADDFLTAPR